MEDHFYKLIELTGTSSTSIADAVGKAVPRAHKTIKEGRLHGGGLKEGCSA